jgi:hypothetical protein
MKSIKDLDVDKIEEKHLIRLQVGITMYQRRVISPIEFAYSNSTFTTEVPVEKLRLDIIGINSGASSYAFDRKTMHEETKNRNGDLRIYEIKIKKEIDRILDLNKVCEEQGIETVYLHIWPTIDGRNPEIEKELFNLYGLFQKHSKRINGVKYRSRRNPDGYCVAIFDTLHNLEGYISYKDITDKIE